MILLEAFIVPTSFFTLSAFNSISVAKNSAFFLFSISFPEILNFPEVYIVLFELFNIFSSAFKVIFFADEIKSLFSIFLALKVTSSPLIILLLVSFPFFASTVSTCAVNSPLLVKLVLVILANPVPIISPLFSIFFPIIDKFWFPCTFP